MSAVPNDQIKRVTGLKFRQDVNSFGPLGYELDLTQLDDEEKDAIKQHISWYKQRRNLLVNGKFSQLLPIGDDQNIYAWSMRKGPEQVIGFYRKLARPNETLDHYLKLPGLSNKAEYSVNAEVRLQGQVLTELDLRLPY
ncbi:alpha-galactosidase [Lactobacillus taiwanensis]|uniref:alpha-galactosidase n=1 Tax=Lactobacillus taiwanensis TaxID=508451 RepID=UPI00242C7E7D|nr:alpha-galactosidase [Lactobacillus taiwanensis]